MVRSFACEPLRGARKSVNFTSGLRKHRRVSGNDSRCCWVDGRRGQAGQRARECQTAHFGLWRGPFTLERLVNVRRFVNTKTDLRDGLKRAARVNLFVRQ